MSVKPYTKEDEERIQEELKGTPYRRVKEKARHMKSLISDEMIGLYGNLDGALNAYEQVIDRLIETAPEKTLDALCEVLEQDEVS